MARILFLAHRIPYPPNKGDKIRSWHFLEHLCSKHEVHLGCYVDAKQDLAHIDFLRQKTESLEFDYVSRTTQKARALTAFLTGQAMTLAAYPKRKLKAYVDHLFAQDAVDLVFIFSSAIVPLIADKASNIPVVTDLVDMDSAKWASYARQHRFPIAQMFAREAKLLLQTEISITEQSEKTALVSREEAELFQASLPPHLVRKVTYITNGVDIEAFAPERFLSVTQDEHLIAFSGAMDYPPNIEAVEWFVAHVWPRVKKTCPKARFMIAGGPAHARVRALAEEEGIVVTGYVDDMAETLAAASVIVAPLQTARGVQNKVLEGMAMAKPVVVSPAAKEGIEAVPGDHLLVAEGADGMADQVISLLADQVGAKALGGRARAHIVDTYRWATTLDRLDQIIAQSLKGGQV